MPIAYHARRRLAAGVTAGLALAVGAVVPTSYAAVAPSAAPSAQPAPVCTTAVTSSQVSWGIKESYRQYITLPFNSGWTLGDGATFTGEQTAPDGAFVFPGESATSTLSSDAALIDTAGSVHFSGHGGVLDTTVSDLKVSLAGDGSASVLADYRSQLVSPSLQPMGWAEKDDAVIATLSGLALPDTTTPGEHTWSQTASAVLSQDGGVALDGGMGAYAPGIALDNLTVGVTYTVSCTTPTPEPTSEPTTQPTTEPTTAPSSEPTTQPTTEPTTAPSSEPTSEPTTQPTTAPSTEPTSEPTTLPTVQPTTPPSPQPTAQPTSGSQDPAASTCVTTVSSGTIDWGVKQSFRRYITMAFNDGWQLADGAGFTGDTTGADGSFTFPASATGSSLGADGSALLDTNGSVRFRGHGGLLDTTISDIALAVDSRGTATLRGDYRSNSENLDGTAATGDNVTLATLSGLPAITLPTTAGTTSYHGTASAALADGGVSALGAGSYTTGTVVDPVSVSLTLSTRCGVGLTQPTGVTPAPGSSSTTGGGATAPAAGTTGAGTAGGAGSQAGTAARAAAGASTEDAVTCKVTGQQVSSGALSWGVKASFRSYITGTIANGTVETSGGAADNGSSYSFTATSGEVDPSAGTATIHYSGTVHFTGHHGILDLTVSDPVLHVTSATSGYLQATVTSSDMSGNAVSLGTVRLADLTFSSASVTAKAVTVSTSAVTLSTEGASAFSGFYSAGQALDNLTASAALTDAVTCYDAQGNPVSGALAHTGADGTALLGASGTALVVLGAALLAARRRQHA